MFQCSRLHKLKILRFCHLFDLRRPCRKPNTLELLKSTCSTILDYWLSLSNDCWHCLANLCRGRSLSVSRWIAVLDWVFQSSTRATVSLITVQKCRDVYEQRFFLNGGHQPIVGDVLLNHKRRAGGHRQPCIIARRLVHAVRITRYPGFNTCTLYVCVQVKVQSQYV